MGNGVPRLALLAVVVLLLGSTLAGVGAAPVPASTTYTLTGYVYEPGASGLQPVPEGITVDLISSTTHQTYTTTTGGSGQFNFSSGGSYAIAGFAPGWWGVVVPPQAHVSLFDGVEQAAVIPANPNPQYYDENSTDLTTIKAAPVTIHGVEVDVYNATIAGNVTNDGNKQPGATVQLLAPQYDGFVLGSNTTDAVTNTSRPVPTYKGYYSLNAPYGTWILETSYPGSPTRYNYTTVTVDGATTHDSNQNLTVNPTLSSGGYDVWGDVLQAADPSAPVPNGGNATVFAPGTGAIYSQTTPPGGYYSIGLSGSQTFDVVLSSVGYGTAWYPITVSPSNPTGTSPLPRNVVVPAISPPANYTTVLNWTGGFNHLNVTTTAILGNDSVFPSLANASVGQLWAQLALDWQHNLTFSESNFPQVEAWLASQGPFFNANQASTTVNGTSFNLPANTTFVATSGCSTSCGLNNSAGMNLGWSQTYNSSAKISTNLKSYSLSFQFRHPTHSESFNYTVLLPAGYALQAGTPAPAQTALVPAGKNGTWTSFTLVSQPSSSASGTFSFSIDKTGSLTASVNVTSSEFTWSNRNVLNISRGNYTAVAGIGENLTFSGANSIFPAGANGTEYQWAFGDGQFNTTHNLTTNHTYAHPGNYSGSLTVTSNGRYTSTVPFWLLIGSDPPTAQVTVNDTNVSKVNGIPYVIVNWSTSLQFNATGSTAPVNGAPHAPTDLLSDAFWNVSDYSYHTTNYTASSGVSPFDNFTYTFDGGGKYITQGTANGTPIVTSKFQDGWQYNITLTVWNYGQLNATSLLVVLVRDTQKPTAEITLKNGKGKVLPTTGVIEGSNHTSEVAFWATNSTDPNNGSIVYYNWTIGNSGNTSANFTVSQEATSPSYALPSAFDKWLSPQSSAYSINLTVTDRAGNKGWVTTTLTVAINTSTRPVLSVGNLTASSSMTDGSGYTVWANVTDLVGQNSTADNLSVRFYLLAPSGSGNEITIGGSPGSVTFYNDTNGTLNSTAWAGPVDLPFNHTVRAEIHFNPARIGTWDLWANATASNEFSGDYVSGSNLDHVQVTLKQNPIVQTEEYGGIAAGAIIVIVALILYFRRRVSKPVQKSSGSRLERGSKKGDDDDDDDDK